MTPCTRERLVYYSLYIAIVKELNINDALSWMGLTTRQHVSKQKKTACVTAQTVS